jgi:TctA family transporter
VTLLILAMLLGTIAGLLSAIPGLHISVLLVGALPLLHIAGTSGALIIIGAMGSGLVAANLAKTFHPATAETIKSATPEQVMAYHGKGLHALYIQNEAVWLGVGVVLLLSLLTLPLARITSFEGIINGVMGALTIPLIIGFLVLVIWQAKHKVATLLTILCGTLLGFYTSNSPAMVNGNSLAPLLAGGFSLPALFMVFAHQGKVKRFPAQQAYKPRYKKKAWSVWGALAGVLTAMTAGMGSGGAVSVCAGHMAHDKYLSMHTASEAANHVFAVLLFFLIGTSHSGTGIALKQQLTEPSFAIGCLLLLALPISLAIGTAFSWGIANAYVKVVTAIPQRTLALGVALLTVTLLFAETSLTGVMVALAAATLGWTARKNFVPNQAMVSVLTGPVLVYKLGLAKSLAVTLGVLH